MGMGYKEKTSRSNCIKIMVFYLSNFLFDKLLKIKNFRLFVEDLIWLLNSLTEREKREKIMRKYY
jgi:hypothetical protein